MGIAGSLRKALPAGSSPQGGTARRYAEKHRKRIFIAAVITLLLLQNSLVPALAAGEGSFDPRVVLDGLISTCGLIILVAGGALGVRMFFNGQMVQAVVAVLIAAFVFTILNTSALTELGSGLKEFIWAGDSVAATGR